MTFFTDDRLRQAAQEAGAILDGSLPAGSDLRFPVDEAIQQFVAEEDIQVGDAVVGCFLDDTVEAGNPPTVQVVDFGLDQ